MKVIRDFDILKTKCSKVQEEFSEVLFVSAIRALGVEERIDKVNESLSSSKTLGRSLNLHHNSPHFLVASSILTVCFQNALRFHCCRTLTLRI